MREKKERRRDFAEGRTRKWKSYYTNLEKETEEKATRRLTKSSVRKNKVKRLKHGG